MLVDDLAAIRDCVRSCGRLRLEGRPNSTGRGLRMREPLDKEMVTVRISKMSLSFREQSLQLPPRCISLLSGNGRAYTEGRESGVAFNDILRRDSITQ